MRLRGVQDFLVKCSYIEIYNEVITDLLVSNSKALKLHTTQKQGTVVVGATENMVVSTQQAMKLIETGQAARHVGSTNMNAESSRSHSIFRMLIESAEKTSDGRGAVRAGELYLVDLAGSERQSSTQATGQRLKEGANINKSLLCLSNVISRLSEMVKSKKSTGHVPFRDSNLTRILERALGGNSRTSIICTVCPSSLSQDLALTVLRVPYSLDSGTPNESSKRLGNVDGLSRRPV